MAPQSRWYVDQIHPESLQSALLTYAFRLAIQLGFGTGTTWYKPDRFSAYNSDMVEMIKNAIKAGYRHIDTAEGYGTEAELGQAIKECGVPRQDLFITTKVMQTLTEGKLEDLSTALDMSLKRLQLDYVDL